MAIRVNGKRNQEDTKYGLIRKIVKEEKNKKNTNKKIKSNFSNINNGTNIYLLVCLYIRKEIKKKTYISNGIYLL